MQVSFNSIVTQGKSCLISDDHSRVILKDGPPDYINANLVEVFYSYFHVKYIQPWPACSWFGTVTLIVLFIHFY